MSIDPNLAKSLFLQAIELPSQEERSAFLDLACAGQPELRGRVENLLQSADTPDSLLDQPAIEIDATQIVVPDPMAVSLDFLQPPQRPESFGAIGGYDVLEVVGRGGMGIVLRAIDAKLNRVVAIKVLVPELAGNPQARRRFLREAQAAAAVCHDHVVTIHGVDDDEKLPFIVMEYIVGQSLQQKIDKSGPLGLKETLRIGMQIAAGLTAAHKQGLVHRDIKPANILLENGVERVKITDFGLARASDEVAITQFGQIAGTPQYMSPEQAMGHSVDQRSDLFSLGSVLYTMCTGRPAFRADSTVAVLRRVCDETPRPISELNPDIPDWLVAIVERLMAKAPEQRFQSASEVANLLEQWLAHCQQPGSVPRPATMTRQPLLKSLEADSKQSFAKKFLSRRMRTANLVIATSAIVLGLLYSFHLPLYLWCHNRALVQFRGDAWVMPTNNNEVLSVLSGNDGIYVNPGRFSFQVRKKPNHRISEVRIEDLSLWPLGTRTEILRTAPQSIAVQAGQHWRITVKHEADVPLMGPLLPDLAEPDFDSDSPPWTTLFNGKDLAGWKTFETAPGDWTVKDHVLTSRGPYSFLYSERGDFCDFQLRAEFRINAAGDSGIIFRSPFELMKYPTSFGVKGYEAQIQARTGSGMNTGSLAVVRANGNWELLTPVNESVAKSDEWATLQITARGHRINVRVNGILTASFQDRTTGLTCGHIALQQSTPQTIVQFRKIEVRTFPDDAATVPVIPSGPDQVAKLQERCAKDAGIPVQTVNPLGMPLRLIPGGSFEMGSTAEELKQLSEELERNGESDFARFAAASSGPKHQVTLTEPFYIGMHEVTLGQFLKFAEATHLEPQAGHHQNWRNFIHGEGNAADRPICGVSWVDAKAFCDWLNTQPDTSGIVESGSYDLPTEAQWEYTCRAGSIFHWCCGSDDVTLERFAVFGQSGQPLPSTIGSRQPNGFGVYDMHGNVTEWCRDWHHQDAYRRLNPLDPVWLESPGNSASGRVVRGGSWGSRSWWTRSTTRSYDNSTNPAHPTGFRVVCKPRLQ
ncbi:MAG: SUMF1/EgtB/PvdO family nonheme iron enzyme [Planctomycetota bacterium]